MAWNMPIAIGMEQDDCLWSIFLYPFLGAKGWTIDRGKEQKTE